MEQQKIGNFLKQLRKEKGLTQEQFAERFYISSRMKAVVMALHSGTSRKMKCPYCGNKSYHKKVLTK